MKLRKRQLVLWVAAIFALGLGFGATVYHQRAKRALADYQEQLIAGGEKLTVDELIPPPVPLEQNGAALFLNTLTFMAPQRGVLVTNPPSGMTMVAPGKARIGWAQPDIRSEKASNTWVEVDAALDGSADLLAQLEELIQRPNLDFNLNYRTDFSLLLPHLVQTKRAAQSLYYAALCDLHRGDAKSAATRLRALLAISQGTTDERLVISQLVRMAVTAIGTAGTWEMLQSPHATDEQLGQIQSDWSRLEFNFAAENAIAMERAMGQMTVEQMRESSTEFRKVASGFAWPPPAPTPASGGDWFAHVEQFAEATWDNTRLKANETAWRFSWAYTDQIRTLRGLQVLIDSVRQARSNGNFRESIKAAEAEFKALGIQDAWEEEFPTPSGDVDIRRMFSKSILSLPSFLKKVTNVEVSRQLIVTAIALQRYKLAHGNYPPDLAALVPQFLPALPRDPVDGKLLRYKPNADGTFLLYSVGEDGEDNFGDAKPAKPESKSLYWQRGRDWVWPQPATPQEIEGYYRREFKQAGN